MSTPLDPLTLPLAGRHLIEASAGTGKTWTIAALYLRQLLQNRREPGQMLVVTFTEAAAAELRERIAARLLEARDALAGLPAADDFLASLVGSLSDHAAARAHLDDALLRLDELAVHTIHGFCGRVLADHAFSAGSRFEADIETDIRPLTAEILGDFWRRRCAAAGAVALDVLYGLWPQGPQSLAKALRNLAGRPGLRLLPPASAVDPAARQAELDAAAQAFAAAWPGGRDEVLARLPEHAGLSRSDKSGYKPDALEALFQEIDAWAAPPQGLPPAGIRRLSPAALDAALTATARKKGIAAPTHPLLDAAAAVAVAAEALTQALQVHTVHAALAYLRAQSESRLVERGRRGFDSLLQELAAALDGPGGPALAGTLAGRYPVVMIDEFQDTDPLQYGLFDRMHRAAADGFGLYLIGDPKQAIYQFRGADVFAYLAARNGVPPAQRHTLTTNQRSTGRLVTAVNALFGRHRRPFVLDAPGQEIDFYEVAAAGRTEKKPLRVDGEALPACEVWWLAREEKSKSISKESAGEQALAATAARVAQLLALGAEGRARVGEDALAGRHIGILVNTNRQAAAAQAALRRVGVDSVCLREDSVYESAEAAALERILDAALDPAASGALRAALATPLLGATAADIAALDGDEAAWESWVILFQSARRRWLTAGPLPMLLGLMQEAGIIGRLHASPDGARALTNLMHLGELLQAQAASRPGLDAQLRFLRDAIAGAGGAAENQQLRLESDANLVQIVTVHKAKGLEWEIVFLPFAGDEKKPDLAGPFEFHDPVDLAFTADLARSGAHAELARKEALAERVRLLYVALTRARQHCVLPFGVINLAEQGALGWLLYGGQDLKELDETAARAPWRALETASDGALVLTDPPAAAQHPAVGAPQSGQASSFAGRIDSRWRVTSYSALAAGAVGADRPDYDAVDAGTPAEPQAALAVVPDAPAERGGPPPIARFPRGAAAGTSLHGLFEALDFPHAHGPALAEAVAQSLARAGYPPLWQPTLERLVADVLDTPLDGQALRLRDIPRAQRRDELEFYFPLARIEAATLNRLLEATALAAEAAALRFDAVEGVLKGYIDLVFEHAGRFYLADYKSNWLGPTAADYAPEALRAAMAEHRYDLQYLVYTVALHRYLRLRLPDYDYERHFGGVYYLFLRGMAPGQGGAGIYFDRPPASLVRALEAALCGGA
ncbi:exodeoxyribonuclease V subunit beta [Immundisolibacter cernigliae]|uniref:RecBCD enzyme subunit RecB n=1 Tax=Immundisolibacter cernigliae TaxID=1810504 RepID=A0A1B1YWV7_9GAMM|nr:exodeoxyribonuclease V subunit beta [Immundisolibacter cernigliae]ANX05335.1 hypothetical protein PG2T_14840 [Immundisolibacter cernigliae]